MPSEYKPPPEYKPPEYKLPKISLEMAISPGLIFGILRYLKSVVSSGEIPFHFNIDFIWSEIR